jgi:hypothetical protein
MKNGEEEVIPDWYAEGYTIHKKRPHISVKICIQKENMGIEPLTCPIYH